MDSYADYVDADRRLVILTLLEECSGYICNEYLLREMLEGYGHAPSQAQLRTDLVWLTNEALVTVRAGGDVLIAKLTARGLDVAQGREECAGVKRPMPE